MQIIQARGRTIPVVAKRKFSDAHATAEALFKKPSSHDKPKPRILESQSKFDQAQNVSISTVVTSYEYSHTNIIPTIDWIAIPDNPQQRDVKVRIAKGRATHLYRLDPAHRKVVVALLPFGKMVKVEGHTRAFIWKNGMLQHSEVPDTVVVEYWKCKDLQAAKDLYDKFDNPVTEENGSDRVNGAANDAGINFESTIMKDGEYSTALRELWSYIFAKKIKRDEKQTVISRAFTLFKRELVLLDTIISSRKKFPQSVMMAAILTLRADPTSIVFWKKYADGHAYKFEGERDAVAIFEDRLTDLLRKSNYVKQREIMGNAAAAVDAYHRNETYAARGYQALNAEKLRQYAVKAFGGK